MKDILDRLLEPFDPSEVKAKPQAVKGNRALAIHYVDARVVMDRLDEVVGVDGWTDSYRVLDQGSVACSLSVRIGEKWISKEDVGSPSEQPDDGDKMKAAYSDALKRAAVKFGIGRYLYRLPHTWADFDPASKKFVSPPILPAWARPKTKTAPPPEIDRHAKGVAAVKGMLARLAAARKSTEAKEEAALLAAIGVPAGLGKIEQLTVEGLASAFKVLDKALK